MFFISEMLAHPFNYFSLRQYLHVLQTVLNICLYTVHKIISHCISVRIGSSAEEIITSCGPVL